MICFHINSFLRIYFFYIFLFQSLLIFFKIQIQIDRFSLNHQNWTGLVLLIFTKTEQTTLSVTIHVHLYLDTKPATAMATHCEACPCLTATSVHHCTPSGGQFLTHFQFMIHCEETCTRGIGRDDSKNKCLSDVCCSNCYTKCSFA
jgi:hypothetical protein